ncbi:META domain-containing protein [Pseudochrobactrum sp. HB0163]|uniref:META domain-containing protein n=1 Tax=Pseudochrobactrum sp. HB0163 TaxID=3450708 RepID=UPI003F6E313D
MLIGKARIFAAACLGLVILGGGALILSSTIPTQSVASEKTIRGTVVYRERIALPPEAGLSVQLLDVSLADAPAEIIAEKYIEHLKSSPVPFTLKFDQAKLLPGHSYALQARISAGDTLWFINDTRHNFDPEKFEPSYEIRVVNVRKNAAIQTPLTLENHEWLTEDIRGAGVIDYAQTTLNIAASGDVSGSGGCNRYFGKATITGETISFGTIGSTFMQCPPALMDQETKFLDVLKQTRRFSITNGKLYLLGENGLELARLASD